MLAYFKKNMWGINIFFKVVTLKGTEVLSSETDSEIFYCVFGG